MVVAEGHEKRILSLCRVGETLWSCSEDRTIRIWNIEVCFYYLLNFKFFY